jgi:hypothetical protein
MTIILFYPQPNPLNNNIIFSISLVLVLTRLFFNFIFILLYYFVSFFIGQVTDTLPPFVTSSNLFFPPF